MLKRLNWRLLVLKWLVIAAITTQFVQLNQAFDPYKLHFRENKIIGTVDYELQSDSSHWCKNRCFTNATCGGVMITWRDATKTGFTCSFGPAASLTRSKSTVQWTFVRATGKDGMTEMIHNAEMAQTIFLSSLLAQGMVENQKASCLEEHGTTANLNVDTLYQEMVKQCVDSTSTAVWVALEYASNEWTWPGGLKEFLPGATISSGVDFCFIYDQSVNYIKPTSCETREKTYPVVCIK